MTYAENNSPISNNSPGGDATDNKKRRRKRSRQTKPPSSAALNAGGAGIRENFSTHSIHGKSRPVEHSEELITQQESPENVLQPWMIGGDYEDDDNTSMREKHLIRQGSEENPSHYHHSRQGNNASASDIRSSHSTKHLPRQSSEDRNSFKRQRSKDRIAGSSKRHDPSKKSSERKHSSHKGPKAHKQPSAGMAVEEIALPPWEQPYHSPPRKDFGLLHIPADDSLLLPDVDPACIKVDTTPADQNETKTTAMIGNDDDVTLTDNNENSCRRDSKNSVLSTTSDLPRRPTGYESGDASAEFD